MTERFFHHRTTGRRGFTLVEVVVTVGLMMLVMGITTQTLFRGQQRTSFTETYEALVRDIRQQQISVMEGDTVGDSVLSDYSVRFESDRYVLFPGSVYVQSNPNNRVITLDPTIRINTVAFAGAILTFARGSGDVRSYDPVNNYVTITQTDTDIQKTISVNEHGVVFVE